MSDSSYRKFDRMDPSEDGFYYLEYGDWYAATKLEEVFIHGDYPPWVARYYVDDAQVRVTLDEGTEEFDDANLEDPTEGQVVVC